MNDCWRDLDEHHHACILPTWHWIRPIPRLWELRRAISVPLELLRPDCSRSPSVCWIQHSMVDNPVFRAIGALRKASMTDTICLVQGGLIEDAAFVVLPPIAYAN